MTPEQTKFLLRIRAQREECGCPPLTDEDWVILGNRELRVTNSHQCGLEDHGRWYVPPSGSANTEPYPLCQLTVGDLRAKLVDCPDDAYIFCEGPKAFDPAVAIEIDDEGGEINIVIAFS